MHAILQHFRERIDAHPWTLIPIAFGLSMLFLSLTKRWQPAPMRRFTERLQKYGEAGVFWVSRRLTQVMLFILFYTAIAAVALAFKLKRSDLLRRRWRPPGSLWLPHDPVPESIQRARRQF